MYEVAKTCTNKLTTKIVLVNQEDKGSIKNAHSTLSRPVSIQTPKFKVTLLPVKITS